MDTTVYRKRKLSSDDKSSKLQQSSCDNSNECASVRNDGNKKIRIFKNIELDVSTEGGCHVGLKPEEKENVNNSNIEGNEDDEVDVKENEPIILDDNKKQDKSVAKHRSSCKTQHHLNKPKLRPSKKRKSINAPAVSSIHKLFQKMEKRSYNQKKAIDDDTDITVVGVIEGPAQSGKKTSKGERRSPNSDKKVFATVFHKNLKVSGTKEGCLDGVSVAGPKDGNYSCSDLEAGIKRVDSAVNSNSDAGADRAEGSVTTDDRSCADGDVTVLSTSTSSSKCSITVLSTSTSSSTCSSLLTPTSSNSVTSDSPDKPVSTDSSVCALKSASSVLPNASATPSTELKTDSSSKKGLAIKKQMTPKQLLKESERKKKKEERDKVKLEKERTDKEKKQEIERIRDEKRKRKMEELEVKHKEKEEKKQKKIEEQIRKDEEKQKKEDERLKKEEEKQKREEERKLVEDEAREKNEKLKAKFAQFFVPKKPESTTPQQLESENLPGPFMMFQVKENMRMAPIVRRSLSEEMKSSLDSFLHSEMNEEKTHLQALKEPEYKFRRSDKTYPLQEKPDDSECEILDGDDEEDIIAGSDIIQENKSNTGKKTMRAKLLQFCENRRPAYYGTWSQKSKCLTGRRPFAKEQVFDYDYDSDDDWEEEETGESLSDSEGEGEEGAEDELDQYEVDDFFVPHGYLSDDEGKDENEDDADENKKTKIIQDENVQKEKLKQKQAEFELEMKQKTKQLKPKVYGCVWMGDRNSHTAYDQLLKILSGHQAVIMWGSCPIATSLEGTPPQDAKEASKHRLEDEEVEESASKKFVRSFPEKAVPDLIRLIHGNCNTKLFLTREFSEYWKKKCQMECLEQDEDRAATPSATCIAKRKIEPKIQELATYGKFSENGIIYKYRTWFVPKEVRDRYGLGNLSFKNSWTYTIQPKVWRKAETLYKEENEDKMEVDDDDTPKQKTPTVNLITKFTKVLNEQEKKLLKKGTGTSIQHSQSFSKEKTKLNNREERSISSECKTTTETKQLSTPSSGHKVRKKLSLTPVLKTIDPTKSDKTKNSIVSFFQKSIEKVSVSSVNAAKAVDSSKEDVITLD